MLKGTLDDFTLPDVFRLITLAKRTGRLGVQRRAGSGDIFFREGDVYFAQSSLSKDPIGQKLVRFGVVTEGQLRKALDESHGGGRRVGEVLVESGDVTVEQIENVIKQQIEDSVFDLLRWELGEFEWEAGAEIDADVPISVSVENLIMEASRRLDEWEMLTRKIPSMHATLAMSQAPPEGALEINITPGEWRVLVLVDGVRTLQDIADMVGLDEMNAMRTMHGLVSAGLVEVSDPGTEPLEEAPAQEAPEPVAEVEPQPVVEIEPEPVPEPEPAPEPVTKAEAPTPPGFAPGPPAFETSEPPAPEPVAQAPAEEPHPVTEEVLDEPVAAAEAPPPDWFQDPDLPVDSFDAPGPDELLTEVPGAPEPAVEESTPAVEETPAVSESDPFLNDLSGLAAPEVPQPVTEQPDDSPRVDRIAAVRELAGLFDDDEKPHPRRAPAEAAPDEPGEGEPEAHQRKRVEDDDQVNKGLISRLIDGVKGL